MNTFTPSKLLITVLATAALLGGCKKNEVVTTPADTAVVTPATTTATAPAADTSMAPANTTTPSTDTTGASGAAGTTGAGMSNPSTTGVTGTSSTMPGMTNDPANDASKPAVRNNSGQTQGTTGSSLPTSDGSR